MDSKWHHIAIKFDGTESSVYVDGTIEGVTISGWVLSADDIRSLFEVGG